MTAWEVEVEQEEDRGDSLHPPFPKGRTSPRKKNNRVKFLQFSRAHNSASYLRPEMIYIRNEPIWDRLFCSLRSGMHNRKLFVMRDSGDQLEALIGTVFPFSSSWHSRNPEKKRIMICVVGTVSKNAGIAGNRENGRIREWTRLRCDNEWTKAKTRMVKELNATNSKY